MSSEKGASHSLHFPKIVIYAPIADSYTFALLKTYTHGILVLAQHSFDITSVHPCCNTEYFRVLLYQPCSLHITGFGAIRCHVSASIVTSYKIDKHFWPVLMHAFVITMYTYYTFVLSCCISGSIGRCKRMSFLCSNNAFITHNARKNVVPILF